MKQNCNESKDIKFTKKSGTNFDRDSYVTPEGDIVFTQHIKLENGLWKRVEVGRVTWAELEATGQTEIAVFLDEDDAEWDAAERRNTRHCCSQYGKRDDPEGGEPISVDRFCYMIDPHASIEEQLFPEEQTINELAEKVRSVVDQMTDAQQDLFWEHVGMGKFLEDIRREDLQKNGEAPSQQSYSKRWNKILAKICKELGVPKPRVRTK